jgi:hypothetical protein
VHPRGAALRRAGATALLLLLLIGCARQNRQLISVSRGGGFTGETVTVEVSWDGSVRTTRNAQTPQASTATSRLSDQQTRELDDAVRRTFASYAGRSFGQPSPDAYGYQLRRHRSRIVISGPTALPPALQDMLDRLEALLPG